MIRPVALAIALTATLGPAAAAHADPALDVPQAQLAAALQCPSAFTRTAHEPVLLVHGTGLTAEQSWAWNYEETLPAAGFDACTVTLPDRALGDIQVATEYVVYAINRIAHRSGRKVDVITHSQGGMEGRWAMRWWPKARRRVDDMVLIASPNHGIVAADACAASGNCWPAVWQMASKSAFLQALNSGSESPGTVSYTNVYSQTDELVEPSSTVPTAGPNVANVEVQSLCPGRPINHAGLLDDAVAGAIVMDALTHPGPADAARVGTASCTEAFAPGLSPADVAGGNAILYSDAAQAFADHSGVAAEPPLEPYAR
ncbi:MAG: putative lipase [Solirubrobacteraceae bacterium]|nr:putative lipase [Solirubrobacteraceae bacterium]